MKIYQGTLESNGTCSVKVHETETGFTTPLQHYVKHSPDGFSFGYAGSGPAELARCIVFDHFGVTPDSEADLPVSYQEFKFDLIATIPEDSATWEISEEDISNWVFGKIAA